MYGFMVCDSSRGEGHIVSYVVSEIGFLGAGVIFKDSGSVRGLNTAATIWCSAAIGSYFGTRKSPPRLDSDRRCSDDEHRSPSARLSPLSGAGGDGAGGTYRFELICRPEDEAHT
jgi:putative Mg2+ transporter-C (MgtC) family protein